MGRVRRDLGLEPQWRERMEQWRASGWSVREFCLRRGLAEPTFYYWKRELRARNEAAAVAAVSRSPASQGPVTKSSRPTFVPVTVLPDSVLAAATVSVEVRCPSGHVVVLSSCDGASLASLFAALAPQAPLARGSQAREAQPC